MKRFFLILLLVLSACQEIKSQEIDENLKFRINSLYEHTILMGEYSNNEVLDKICLDMSKIKAGNISEEEKIRQMALAFNATISGNIENQVKILEARMESMMDYWNEAQEEDARKRCY